MGLVADSPLFRSSRPDYIETFRSGLGEWGEDRLFRSSRPDYIETIRLQCLLEFRRQIVPVFQTGLH